MKSVEFLTTTKPAKCCLQYFFKISIVNLLYSKINTEPLVALCKYGTGRLKFFCSFVASLTFVRPSVVHARASCLMHTKCVLNIGIDVVLLVLSIDR